MSTAVLMPQMGESVAEGTIVRWFKSVGDFVKRDAPLFEISTDKVDTEIPAPTSGYLTEILVLEGKTVPIDTVVCYLSSEVGGEGPSGDTATGKPAGKAASQSPRQTSLGPAKASTPATQNVAVASWEERIRKNSSPVVRQLAAEHGIDLTTMTGTGTAGRVTKADLQKYLESRVEAPSGPGRTETLSPMRRKIAEHMVQSRRTSAHVTTVFEMDMSNARERKDALSPQLHKTKRTKLTYLPFIIQATAAALRSYPVLNASMSHNEVRYHDDINLGIAVALDDGLIVPVIRQVDTLSLAELAETINDVARRARAKKLKHKDVQGGTFTITNPGMFGALIGTPIIHQPQVAILCVGKIEKRPVVLPGSDTIAARSMAYFSLSYDHRLIDGAIADRFLAELKDRLETGTFEETVA